MSEARQLLDKDSLRDGAVASGQATGCPDATQNAGYPPSLPQPIEVGK
jgi:hypothetical protein